MKYSEENIKDIIEWDIQNWKKSLNFFDENINFKNINNSLEIGSRKGGMSLWLALHGCKNIICTDYVDNNEIARELHFKYNEICEKNISYKVVDATKMNYVNEFDLIVFKSILGGIGCHNNKLAQEKTIKNIYKALKPGGKLIFIENAKASYLHQFCRKKFTNWGEYWRYLTKDELISMCSMFSKVNIKMYGFIGCFGKTEKQRMRFGKIDNLLCKILPDRFKYIIYGILTK